MVSLIAAVVVFVALCSGVESNSCDRPANRIIAENCLPGAPSAEWDVNGAGDPTIQGYSSDISYNVGATAEFKVNTDSADYRVDIYRTGFYQGLGARRLATLKPHVALPQRQPSCHRDSTTHIYDCREWAVSVRWSIPSDAVSGVYIARLVRHDGEPTTWRADNSPAQEDVRFAMPGGASMRKPRPQPHAYGASGHGQLRNALKEPRASLIYFVVRDDSSTSDIYFQTADTVWQAYNMEGGTSTYGSFDPANPLPRCFKASLNRPLRTRQLRAVNAYFGSEYPVSRFLEANGYDVTYAAGVDTDRSGHRLLRHKVFLSVGHDEYWSGQQRKNVEAARDAGVHALFFSGNEMYWRIRWEDNYRVMVCYKESQSLHKIDPNATEWTGTFRDSRDINPLGANPENSMIGQIFTMNAWRNDPLIVPYAYSKLRQWRNTAVSRLLPGQRAVLFRGILGHEIDEDLDNGFRPNGIIRLSETPIDNVMYIMDHGSTFDSGSATHHLTMYRAASGAIVFGAGTVQWGWALDGFHDGETTFPPHLVNHLNTRIGHDPVAPEVSIQQFTINLLADVGANPGSLSEHLQQATASKDQTPPTCRVVSQTSGDGAMVVVVEARDDEGEVGSVDVRVGSHWHPCSRTVTGLWEFTAPTASEPVACRATDDSLNLSEAYEGAAEL